MVNSIKTNVNALSLL